ncbi:hypothetical protein ABBQ38_001403 [Trebouxia sp. C0009 RCD-2024]
MLNEPRTLFALPFHSERQNEAMQKPYTRTGLLITGSNAADTWQCFCTPFGNSLIRGSFPLASLMRQKWGEVRWEGDCLVMLLVFKHALYAQFGGTATVALLAILALTEPHTTCQGYCGVSRYHTP